MANYYYLGRRAYSNILVWVFISVLFAMSGLLIFIISFSLLGQQEAKYSSLKERESSYERIQAGSRSEVALKAVKRYIRDRGKIGVKDNLKKAFVENAKYELYHVRLVLDMIHKKKPMGEIEQMLKDSEAIGLVKKINEEDALAKAYEEFIKGSDRGDELADALQNEKVPVEIQEVLKDGLDFGQGAKSYLKDLEGETENVRVAVLEMQEKESKLIEKTNEKYDHITKIFPELKKVYFEKSQELEEASWKKFDTQKEAWNVFIEKTKDMVEKRRKESIELFAKEKELKELEKLMKVKVKGRDWIPPLDLVDGEILAANLEQNIVVIDLGRQNGLRIGQRFDVLRMQGDVIQDKKGRIEVTKLFTQTAVCKILSSEGDGKISNKDKFADGEEDQPFDRKIAPTYVLSGEFNKKYSKKFVAHMIKFSGGVIHEKVDRNIKYLILGDIVDEDVVQSCRQLGVRVVRVRDVPRHLDLNAEEIETLRDHHWN